MYTWTHSGFQVGLIVALQTLPILLFGPLGGTIADRFGKYYVLFYTQALAGATPAMETAPEEEIVAIAS